MTNPLLSMIKHIEHDLTLARLQRSHLAGVIYTLTQSNAEVCELLLAQLQRIAELDHTVDKHIEALYDILTTEATNGSIGDDKGN